MAPRKKAPRKPRGRVDKRMSPALRKACRRIEELESELAASVRDEKQLEEKYFELDRAFNHVQKELKKVDSWYSEEKKKTTRLEIEVAKLTEQLSDATAERLMLVKILRHADDALSTKQNL